MENKNSESNISKRFYLVFLLLFGAVCLLIIGVQSVKPEFASIYIWHIQLFFLLLGMGNHLISSRGLKNKGDMHLYYMASMSVRFFLALLFLFCFVYVMKSGYYAFVINFFVLYFVYTSFEIYFLLRNLRPDFKTNGTVDKKI